jgi:predicted PurR-regulated permease PerM
MDLYSKPSSSLSTAPSIEPREESKMRPATIPEERNSLNRTLEASIHVGLSILLAISCLLILAPFIPLLAWGIIIAVAAYPGFKKFQQWLGNRKIVAAVLFTVLSITVLIVPAVLLAGTLVDGMYSVAAQFRDGVVLPPPPPRVEQWPIIGGPLNKLWDLASKDLTAAVKFLSPQIKAIVPRLFSASAGVGLALLEFLLSLVVAGVLLGNAHAANQVTCSLFNRLFGSRGGEFQDLIGATIRSISTGILGVALIQAVLAGLGFFVARLPAAGLWGVLFLFAAILQAGVLVLIPAIVYMFAISSGVKATCFLIWCIIVGLIDNVLKPILLGRGVAVPMVVVFVGAIGGFLSMGIIGLFVGAVVLSVGYKLFLAWIEQGVPDVESL